MPTDSHIEVISQDHYYAYSRRTGMTFYNYESPCQTRINAVLATSLYLVYPKNFFIHLL